MANGNVAPENLVAVRFNGQPVNLGGSSVGTTAGTTAATSTASVGTTLGPVANAKYDYAAVLRASLLFYEAQRAGKLPATNRISWRADSMLMDKGNNGEDLTGGYFDAGDFVKFGFPMAAFTTLMAWGAIDYEKAYVQSGQLTYVREAIRWSTDYFLKVKRRKPSEKRNSSISRRT